MILVVFIIAAIIGGVVGKGNLMIAFLAGAIGVSIYIGFMTVKFDFARLIPW